MLLAIGHMKKCHHLGWHVRVCLPTPPFDKLRSILASHRICSFLLCSHTGFQIQLKGPDLSSTNKTVSHSKQAKEYQTLQVRPASSRSTNISGLDPKARYHFRVIPMAGRMAGKPSEQLVIGPGWL